MHKCKNIAAPKNEEEETLQVIHSLFNNSLFLIKQTNNQFMDLLVGAFL